MAPKPRPEGKVSSPSKDGHSSAKSASQSMPPPPVPVRASEPQGMLVVESLALANCLKVCASSLCTTLAEHTGTRHQAASVKVGKIYGFYADAKSL